MPEVACKNQCVFCNQKNISSTNSIPSPQEVYNTINTHLASMKNESNKQIAFFGGSFTGLPHTIQTEYLAIAYEYIQAGKVQGIRLSTRPDYISDKILETLQTYGVTDIELGAQSFDNSVLKLTNRNHSSDDIKKASEKILNHGFKLGLQMMIGLPGDSYEKSIKTAQSIVQCGAHSTRIYPCLVIADTQLAHMYAQGTYSPLSLTDAVNNTADICSFFDAHAIQILRVGLHPNKDFDSKEICIAGPYHQSFKQLVYTRIWEQKFKNIKPQKGKLSILVSCSDIPYAVGYKSFNKKSLQKTYGWVSIKAHKSIQKNEFSYSYN